MSTPAIAPTSLDHAPAQQTTCPWRSAPGSSARRDALVDDIDRRDLAALPHVRTACVPPDDVLRRDVAVELAERRRQEPFRVDLGHDVQRFVDRELARRHAERVLEGEGGAKALDIVLVVEQEQVAVLMELDTVHLFELVEISARHGC